MSSQPNKSSTESRGGLIAEVIAIDTSCPIFKSGAGYCWTYARSWGMTEPELCECCWRKHDELRTCPGCDRHCLDPNLWDFKRHMCLTCAKEKPWPQQPRQRSLTAPIVTTPVRLLKCSSTITSFSAVSVSRIIPPTPSVMTPLSALPMEDALPIPCAVSEDPHDQTREEAADGGPDQATSPDREI